MTRAPISQSPHGTEEPREWDRRRGRWVLAATVMGSAMPFIDSTVVNIALPAVGSDLGAGTSGLTWVVNAYALTLAAFVLLGGSVGDRYGRRRIFVVGVTGFALASGGCGLAPDVGTLIAARAVQGVGGALLIPASLAILQSSFPAGQRAAAIGAWSGLTGVAAALGPFIGGWLVQVGSWRWVFLINLPVAVLVVIVAQRHMPETRGERGTSRLDLLGAALVAGSLGALTYGLTSWAANDFISIPVVGFFGAALLLGGLLLWRERTTTAPLLPAAAFRSHLFVATNAITLGFYAAFGAIFFSLVIALQVGAGLTPMAAGLSLLPVTLLMLLFSPSAGRLTERVGPRLPMTVGPVISAVGVVLLARVGPDPDYVADVLLGTTVFGAGLTLLVTPLTATVLSSLPDAQAGFASGVNNAVARSAGLLAVAAIPVIGGLGTSGLTDPAEVLNGFSVIAKVCAALLALGALLAALTVRTTASHPTSPSTPSVTRRHCTLTGPAPHQDLQRG